MSRQILSRFIKEQGHKLSNDPVKEEENIWSYISVIILPLPSISSMDSSLNILQCPCSLQLGSDSLPPGRQCGKNFFRITKVKNWLPSDHKLQKRYSRSVNILMNTQYSVHLLCCCNVTQFLRNQDPLKK